MKGHPFTVRRRDGTSGVDYQEYVNTVTTRLVEIYRRWIPGGEVWRWSEEKTQQLLLGVAETIEAPGDHSSQATTYAPARILKSDGEGYDDARYNQVFLTADGTERTVTAAVDFEDVRAGGTAGITCSDETNADHQYCYPIAEPGRLVISLENPNGAIKYPLVKIDVLELHMMNQGALPGLRIPNLFPMPEEFAILIELEAAWTIAFASGATLGAVSIKATQFNFALEKLPIRAFSEGRDEPDLGANLRKKVESMMLSAPR